MNNNIINKILHYHTIIISKPFIPDKWGYTTFTHAFIRNDIEQTVEYLLIKLGKYKFIKLFGNIPNDKLEFYMHFCRKLAKKLGSKGSSFRQFLFGKDDADIAASLCFSNILHCYSNYGGYAGGLLKYVYIDDKVVDF